MWYRTYHGSLEHDETKELHIFKMHVIPETDEDFVAQEQPSTQDDLSVQPINPVQKVTQDSPSLSTTGELKGVNTNKLNTFQPIAHEIPDDPKPTMMDPKDKLLQWLYWLGHLPFKQIMQLIHQGQLPK